MWRLRWWLWRHIGLRGWDPPKGFEVRYWLIHVWNEYDDWLYNGIHGFRVLGAEFFTQPRWLNWACWRILPLLRFFIRRPEKKNI